MTADEAPLLLSPSVPWFGARRLARRLAVETQNLRTERDTLRGQLDRLTGMSTELVSEVKQLRAERVIALEQLERHGALDLYELDNKKRALEKAIIAQSEQLALEKEQSLAHLKKIDMERKLVRSAIVETEELSLLQEAGVYRYRHPLTDAVAYQGALARLQDQISVMVKKDGGAVTGTTEWTVNGSAADGRAMVRDFSKLLLRAFNAEADNMVRGMKPYKLESALNRLSKVATTIERLGASMHIRISPAYHQLRVRELELTADFLEKQAEEKAKERAERERLREERKVAQEIERERAKLEKEREHYTIVLATLMEKGDDNGAARIREQLVDVAHAIAHVDYRAANIRAGYVYVISNVGSFGENMVKIGMTRRLDPMDRVRELSDASVPFNFDVHALFFSNDAVTIEAAMHARLAAVRVNAINRRREFFYTTPQHVKAHLSELAGELLEYQELPEAIEFRQGLHRNALPAGLPMAAPVPA